MRYLPHTETEVRQMLRQIGVDSVDALFQAIPENKRLNEPLRLEPALGEMALMDHLDALASGNRAVSTREMRLSFLGAGMYDHHIPPAVDQLLLRSEFYTAYTPYQAEVAQGTLQAIFEFQTTVCEILGTEVANASMYDGASACAEAALMARRITKRSRIAMSDGLHPDYRATVITYLKSLSGAEDAHVDQVPIDEGGSVVADALPKVVGKDTAAIIVGYPNFFGNATDLQQIGRIAADAGALLIVATAEPYAFGVIEPPGQLGADIVVGEGQGLAVPPQFGGPGVGLFACRESHVRQMPGRLVGETVDKNGDRGFVLTLSTREQHIRRERATSNICTNHGLIALALAIRTAMLGRRGFTQVSHRCLSAAEYAKKLIRRSSKYDIVSNRPTFNEFAVRRTDGTPARELLERLEQAGIHGGVPLGDWYPDRGAEFLVAFTERHRRTDIDALVKALEDA